MKRHAAAGVVCVCVNGTWISHRVSTRVHYHGNFAGGLASWRWGANAEMAREWYSTHLDHVTCGQ